MWHASAAAARYACSRDYLRARAFDALVGIGSIVLGQWEEWTGRAFHVRRRLSEAEMKAGGIERAIDVRGTDEGRRRIERVLRWAPPQLLRIVEEEATSPS